MTIMLKFIFIILIVVTLYFLWRMLGKQKINAVFDEQREELSQLMQNVHDDDELPEKSKTIKNTLDAERVKLVDVVDVEQGMASVEEIPIHKQDQLLFDEVAKLFFEKAIQIKSINQAEQIQQEFLNKMPMSTQSQCGDFDCGEWSIFWSYDDQSLEYYVGRYGVFYAHVDREGVEHKAEFKDCT